MKKSILAVAVLGSALTSHAATQAQIDKATKNLAIQDGVIYSIFDDPPGTAGATPTPAPANPLVTGFNSAVSGGTTTAYLDSLSPADRATLYATLDTSGKSTFVSGLSNAAATTLYAAMSPAEFHALVNSGLPGGSQALAAFETMQQPFRNALDSGNYGSPADWSKFNSTGLNMAGKDLTPLIAKGVTGANLDKSQWVDWTNFSGMNMTGLDATGRDFEHSNLSNTTGLSGAQLSNAQALLDTNFQNVDLTGFSAANTVMLANNFEGATGLQDGAALNGARSGEWVNLGPGNGFNGTEWGIIPSNSLNGLNRANLTGQSLSALDTNNISLRGTNLTNTTGLTATKLAQTTQLGDDGGQNMILTGTGITRSALEAALVAAGKNPYSDPNYNLDGITF